MVISLRRVGIGVMLDVPMRIGPDEEDDNKENFLEDDEVDKITLGGEHQVVNFQLQELQEEDEGE